MDYKDYYKVFGLEKTATADEIKKKYRKLAVQYHPDKNPGNKAAEEKFKDISEAYEVLGNKEKRRKYDELGQNWKQYEQSGPANQRRSAGSQRVDYEDEFGGSGFSDFFEAFFGGSTDSFNRQRRRPQKGRDIEATIDLSLEEAYHGTEKTFALNENSIRMPVKQGVRDGQVLRLKGKGLPGSGGNNGDLLIKVNLLPDPVYTREGDNLVKNIDIDFYTALLGGKVTTNIFGKQIQVPVKPQTQAGAIFRLKNMGMPAYGKTERGYLLLKSRIVLPPSISSAEIDLITKAHHLRNNEQ